MRCKARILVCSICAGVILWVSAAVGQDDAGPSVLILQSLDTQSSPYDVPTMVFRQQLQERFESPVSYAEFGLDARWGIRKDREPLQVALLQDRFESQPADLVVCIGPSAIDFWLRNRDEFQIRIPSLLVAREGMVTPDMLRAGDAGIVSEFAFTHVMDEIVALLPETRHVVVVFGASELERSLTAAADKDLVQFADRISLTFTSDLRVGEIENLLSGLPEHSAVLFGIFTIDAAGHILPFDTGLKRFVAASKAPIFGVFDHELGDGIVGGKLIPTKRMGEEMAWAAFRQLKDPGRARVFRKIPLGEPEYDWQVLKKWNIDPGLLPAGSRMLFRPPSLWSQYGRWVLVTCAVLAAQTLLIVILLINRRRLRIAEVAGARLTGRLISAHEDERWRIARELHDDLSQRLAGLAIDAGFLSRGPEASGYNEALMNLQPELARISDDVHAMSYRLHPSMLGDLGLNIALRTEIDRIRRRTECRIDARIDDLTTSPDPDIALCVYRIVQEALNNALKHSDAEEISVSLAQDGATLHLEVRDDGKGFNVKTLEDATGIGISGMQERARLAGGTLHLQSAPGKGTTVIAKLPLTVPAT